MNVEPLEISKIALKPTRPVQTSLTHPALITIVSEQNNIFANNIENNLQQAPTMASKKPSWISVFKNIYNDEFQW